MINLDFISSKVTVDKKYNNIQLVKKASNNDLVKLVVDYLKSKNEFDKLNVDKFIKLVNHICDYIYNDLKQLYEECAEIATIEEIIDYIDNNCNIVDDGDSLVIKEKS